MEVYKLFRCLRCYGKQDKHTLLEPEYIMENTNMNVLIQFITNLTTTTDKEYSYYIQKFIGDEIRWRQLTTKNVYNKWEKRNITTTWEKYIWNNKHHMWKLTNYRYKDEIIC